MIYHETKHGIVYHADCLDVMAGMADKSVDLVLTDPPYGIGIDGQKQSINSNPKHNRKHIDKMNWDNGIPQKIVFNHIKRCSCNAIVWGGNYFVPVLTEGHKGWVVWDKGQRGLTMSDCELAYSSFDVPTRIVTINRVELLLDNTEHPTQKPVKLFEWCLHNYSKENQTILDPFAGSGTTAIACIRYNRKYILIEKEEKYCEIIAKRIDSELDQTDIFRSEE
ncbi:MAG: site-specific DNA-methyltransferase [Clostridia bacterium]|nr:site-specific DNA-methyltransferase [Clostridia bacterium]